MFILLFVCVFFFFFFFTMRAKGARVARARASMHLRAHARMSALWFRVPHALF
jgi:hypothetical protein